MPKSLPVLFALLLTAIAASPAEAAPRRDPATLDLEQAQQTLTKAGPAVKVLYTPGSGAVTYLIGGGGVEYMTDNLYLGGAGFGGISGTASMGYGGFVAGFEGNLAEDQYYDMRLLLGGGGGSGTGGSLAFEPEVSYSRRFGEGYRGAVTLGYLYMPTAPTHSGVTLGLRLDFKTLSLTLPINE